MRFETLASIMITAILITVNGFCVGAFCKFVFPSKNIFAGL